jgi:hypothetical protein
MPTITWKAALGGGLVVGAGFAGLAQAGDNQPTLPVTGVELRLASANQQSPLTPSRLVTTTTVALPAIPPVPTLQVESVNAVNVAPVATVAVVATTTELPDICPGGDFTGSSWDDSCGAPPPVAVAAGPASVNSPNSPASPPSATRSYSADSPASAASPASAGSAGSAGS